MLDTEESSSDTDADWRKLESKNPYLRLLALGKAKDTMSQYLLQDIDGLDVKLLFGIYQRKVHGAEEIKDITPDILDKIIDAKRIGRQRMKGISKEEQLPALLPEVDPDKGEKSPMAKKQVEARKKKGKKGYLHNFYIKPSYNVNQSISTNLHNPTPVDLGQPEHFKNEKGVHNGDYNLDFEPYASKYDNKLVVDPEGGDVLGMVKRRPGSSKLIKASPYNIQNALQGTDEANNADI